MHLSDIDGWRVELHRMRGRMAKQAEQEALRAAADASARRAALLAEASRALANSLDRNAILTEVARMCVPALADYGVATSADGRTSWAVAGAAGSVEMDCQAPWLKEAFGEFMRGRPEILHHPSAPFPALRIGECPEAHALLVLPLSARGGTGKALVRIRSNHLLHGPMYVVEAIRKRWRERDLLTARDQPRLVIKT